MKKSNRLLALLLAGLFVFSAVGVFPAAAAGSSYTVSGAVQSYRPGLATALTLKQNGQGLYTTVIAAENGEGQVTQRFTFTGVAAGTYDLVIEKDHSLPYTITGVAVSGDLDLSLSSDPAVAIPSLFAGDIDRNGFIDATDITVLAHDTGLSEDAAASPLSDLTGDGFRDALDISVLSFNLLRSAQVVDYPAPSSFTVSFEGGEGAVGTAPASVTVEPGTTITLPQNPFTRDGYDFIGWKTGSTTLEAGASYAVTGSAVFTAQWSAIPTEEHSWTLIDPATLSNDFQFTYYNFNGDAQVTSADASLVDDQMGIVKTVAAGRAQTHINMNSFKLGLNVVESVDWYALLPDCDPTAEALYLELNLYVSDASQLTGNQTVKIYNDRLHADDYWEWSIPASDFSDGWNNIRLPLDADHLTGSVSFAPNGDLPLADLHMTLFTQNSQQVDIGFGTIGVTNYATAPSTLHTVTFSGGEGAVGSAPVQAPVAHGKSVILPENTFTRTGYTFIGWSNGTNTFRAGDYYTVTADAAFTAIWMDASQVVAATYAAGGNSSATVDSDPMPVGSAITLPVCSFTQDGAAFAGWYDGSVVYSEGCSYVLTADTTFTAQWITGDESLIPVTSLTLADSYTFLDTVHTNGTNMGGTAITMKTADGYVTYDDGLCVHASDTTGVLTYAEYDISDFDGAISGFTAVVNPDYQAVLSGVSAGSLRFMVFCDGTLTATTNVRYSVNPAIRLYAPVPAGTEVIRLAVDNGDDGCGADWGSWADASLVVSEAAEDMLKSFAATTPDDVYEVGDTIPVTVSGVLFSDEPMTDIASYVTYQSSAPAVASVAADGTVSALSVGEAEITATATVGDRTMTDSITLRVFAQGTTVNGVPLYDLSDYPFSAGSLLTIMTPKVFNASNGIKLPYRIYLPENYDPDEEYPLLMWLHGAGNRGDNNVNQINDGFEMFRYLFELQNAGEEFIIIAPQCQETYQWVNQPWTDGNYDFDNTAISPYLFAADELYKSTVNRFAVDTDRLYITGGSMGGFGSWDILMRNPGYFAAAVIFFGGGDPDQAANLALTEIWTYHGTADPAVPVDATREMVEAIRDAGGDIIYTEKEGGLHTWPDGDTMRAMYTWLFEQSKDGETGTMYAVSFTAGADDVTGTIPTHDVAEGGRVKLPVPPYQRTGYVFTGWSDGQTFYEAGTVVTITAPVTFTAVWEEAAPVEEETVWTLIDPDTASSDLQFKFYNFDGTDVFMTANDAATVDGKRALARTVTAGRAQAHINMNSFKLGLERVDNIDWYAFLEGCDPTADDYYLVVNLYIEDLDHLASNVDIQISNNAHSSASFWKWTVASDDLTSGWNHLRLPMDSSHLNGTVKFAPSGALYLSNLSVVLYTDNTTSVKVGIGTVNVSDSAVEVVHSFALTFLAGEGTGTAPDLDSAAENAIIALPACTYTRDGYLFAGWSDGNGTYPAGYAYTVTGDTTFTATWMEEDSPLTPFPATLHYSAPADLEANPVDVTFTPTDVTVSYEDDRTIVLSIAAENMATDRVFQNFTPTAATYSGDLLSDDGLTVNLYSITATDGTILSMTSRFTWDEANGILRKTVDYAFSETASPIRVNTIYLDLFDLGTEQTLTKVMPDYTNTTIAYNQQSQPVFFEDYYLGVEYPTATTQNYNGRVQISHAPCFMADAGTTYSTRTEIVGICGDETASDAFWNYLYPQTQISHFDQHFYINYNSWWSQKLLPFTEARIEEMMDEVYGYMGRYGAYFDDFTMDNGWADMYSTWEIDSRNFPNGFSNILTIARENDSGLGIWFSPAGVYAESTNIDWARSKGYKIRESSSPKCLCGADENWINDMADTLSDIIRTYEIDSVKIDGWYTECSEADHGHIPGFGPSEKATENLIHLLTAIHDANPDLMIECVNDFGIANPSPWWLTYATVTNGSHGDDSPYGLIPAPVYRESYTTARDYYSLQGEVNFNIPITSQTTFGVTHQTNDDFTNDMIAVFMRGQAYVGQYIGLDYMNEARWARYAAIVNWMRANESSILSYTEPYLPDSWNKTDVYPISKSGISRGVYGQIHDGLMMLRNPWMEQSVETIHLPLDASDTGTYDLVSLYPEVRVYARNVTVKDAINVPVNGYETLVLAVKPCGEVAGNLYVPANNNTISSFDYTVDYNADTTHVDYDATGTVTIGSGANTKLCLLIEANEAINIASFSAGTTLTSDGQPLTFTLSGTDNSIGAWDATGEVRTYHWIWAIADLPAGTHNIQLSYSGTQGGITNIGAYLWATKNTSNGAVCANSLPSPEMITVESDVLYEYFMAEHQSYILLTCDTTEGVMDTPYLTLDTNDKIQGTASIKRTTDNVAILGKVYPAPMDLSAYKDNGVIHLWVYVSDASKTQGQVARFQIASDGGNGNVNAEWEVSGLVTGWNEVTLPISDAMRDDANWSSINFFRFFQYTSGTAVVGIDFVTVDHASAR